MMNIKKDYHKTDLNERMLRNIHGIDVLGWK